MSFCTTSPAHFEFEDRILQVTCNCNRILQLIKCIDVREVNAIVEVVVTAGERRNLTRSAITEDNELNSVETEEVLVEVVVSVLDVCFVISGSDILQQVGA